jgi:hypothetical protein
MELRVPRIGTGRHAVCYYAAAHGILVIIPMVPGFACQEHWKAACGPCAICVSSRRSQRWFLEEPRESWPHCAAISGRRCPAGACGHRAHVHQVAVMLMDGQAPPPDLRVKATCPILAAA